MKTYVNVREDNIGQSHSIASSGPSSSYTFDILSLLKPIKFDQSPVSSGSGSGSS